MLATITKVANDARLLAAKFSQSAAQGGKLTPQEKQRLEKDRANLDELSSELAKLKKQDSQADGVALQKAALIFVRAHKFLSDTARAFQASAEQVIRNL